MRWEVILNFSLHILNIVLLIFGFKKLSISLKLVGVFILLTCFVELYALKLMLQSIDNNFLYHFLTPMQYALIAAAYGYEVKNKKIKQIIFFSIPVILIVGFFISLKIQKLDEYNSIFCAIKHAILSFCVLYFFYETFLNKKMVRLTMIPFFWISFGLLFSSLGNFFIEGLMSLLITKSKNIALSFYLIGVSLTYFFYLTITIAFFIRVWAKYDTN